MLVKVVLDLDPSIFSAKPAWRRTWIAVDSAQRVEFQSTPDIMATMVAIGVFFISAAPSLALLFGVLLPNSHLFVLSILGAFMWSLAMMLSGIIWLMIPPLRNVYAWSLFIAVTMQELMRFVLHRIFRIMSRHGDGVEAFLRPGVKNDLLTGMSIGVGFAFLSAMVNFYATVVDEFASNTAIYTERCSINFVVAASGNALAFSLLHISLGILVWPAYSEDPSSLKVLFGYVLHLGISLATLGSSRKFGCTWVLILVFALVFIVMGITAVQSKRRVKKETD